MKWRRSLRLGSEADYTLGFNCRAVPGSCLAGLDSEVIRGIRLQVPELDPMRASIRAPRRFSGLRKIARISSVIDYRAARFICAPGNHRRMIRHRFQNGALRDVDLSRHRWRRAHHYDRGEYVGE